jgi:hypothetical protein
VVEAGESENPSALNTRSLLHFKDDQNAQAAQNAPNWNVTATSFFVRPVVPSPGFRTPMMLLD